MTSDIGSTDAHLDALRSSVERLRDIAATIHDDQLTNPAYPTEWSIADVLSHIGSGAAIQHRRLEDTLAQQATPDDYAPTTWQTWNAKPPTAQRADALTADAALLGRIQAVTPDERRTFTFAMGPMTFDFDQFVDLRLNEHALHTWDIDVVLDPTATIPPPAAELVVDNLDLIARYTAKPTGDTTTITVTTTNPGRNFTIDLTPQTVTFTPTAATTGTDLQLPAEAFVRLVYGRLDPDHTPPDNHHPALAILRQVFPGP